jgi:hypothetical protein
MVYLSSNKARERADLASNRALKCLVNDMVSLVDTQPSVVCILRYMVLAYSYNINYVVLGQDPYPDHIVPYLGSAYSQVESSVSTPTTDIICKHFSGSNNNDGVDVRNMIRNNWRLLAYGYLFINSDYTKSHIRSDVQRLEVYDLMVEYNIVSVCSNHKGPGIERKVSLIALGTPAHHIAVNVSSRLRANDIATNLIHDG